MDNEWKPFVKNKMNVLIQLVLDRIKQFIYMHKPFARKNRNELYFLIDDKPITDEDTDKYSDIMKLDYNSRFDFHVNNLQDE